LDKHYEVKSKYIGPEKMTMAFRLSRTLEGWCLGNNLRIYVSATKAIFISFS